MDAAIELLGTGGMRALTHRAVDTRAGLPPGSTSNYFRTSAALLQGVVEHMVAVEIPQVAAGGAPSSPQALADRLVALFDFSTGPNRVMTAARLALFVEAGHDEDVRSMLARGRATFEGLIRAEFAAAGSPDPALATHLLGACFEGLFIQRIGQFGEVDARRIIEAVVRASM